MCCFSKSLLFWFMWVMVVAVGYVVFTEVWVVECIVVMCFGCRVRVRCGCSGCIARVWRGCSARVRCGCSGRVRRGCSGCGGGRVKW